MRKNGNKILAILLTAVCLIGVLPLSVSAAYETVYVPPLASVTHNTRPSSSKGGLVASADYNSYTIPVPLDTQNGVTFNIDGLTYYPVILFLDANLTMLRSGSITNVQEFYFDSQQLQDVSFIVFGIASIEPILLNVVVQHRSVEVVVGAQNLAHQERYEQIEVPAPPLHRARVFRYNQFWICGTIS